MQERKKNTKSSGELLVHYYHIPDARIIQCDIVVDTDHVLFSYVWTSSGLPIIVELSPYSFYNVILVLL
jgi:hypothetical protein